MSDLDDLAIIAAVVGGLYVVTKLLPDLSKAVSAAKTDAGLGSPAATYAEAVKVRKDLVTSKIPADNASFIYENGVSYRISESSLASMSANQRREFLNGESMANIAKESAIVAGINSILFDPFGLKKMWSLIT